MLPYTSWPPTRSPRSSARTGWPRGRTPIELENRAQQVLADTVRDALGAEAPVEQFVVQGHPAQALVDRSDQARLIVVGSRGRGGFTGLLLGSVSQHVVSHARCPVVVMPRNAPD